MELHTYIVNHVGYYKIIIIVVALIIFLVIRHFHIKSQYSKEAWKIVKKNGRKAIFWYDEYGNETYKKPTKSNPPNRHRRGL